MPGHGGAHCGGRAGGGLEGGDLKVVPVGHLVGGGGAEGGDAGADGAHRRGLGWLLGGAAHPVRGLGGGGGDVGAEAD